MRIFIIGFMGSGKSTLGRPVARAMGYDFVDLDHYIEQQEGATISQIFESGGEANFRALEHRYLRELVGRDNVVISTGGGAPCFNDNMTLMKASGTTIYLKQEPELLASRLENAKVRRPLLEGKNHDELLHYIRQTLAQREEYYEQASIVVANPSRDAQRIINILKVGTEKY